MKKAASTAALGFLQRFILLVVQVAEVHAPEHDLFLGCLIPEAVERVSQLFGNAQAQQKPAVLG